MAFQKFREYLSASGKMDKVTVSGDADTGPNPTKEKSGKRPPKAVKSGKHWKDYTAEAAQVSDGGDGTKPAEYSAPGTDPGLQHATNEKGEKSPVKGLYKNPLADEGPKNLVYNPKVWDGRLKMKKLHDTTPEEGTKTEQFLNATKDLSTNQYAEFILSQRNAKAVKQILETVEIIGNDELLIETFVREIKRKGGLPKLTESILDQREAYHFIAQRLTNEINARRLQREFIEMTDAPATDDIVKEKPASKSMPPNNDSIGPEGQPVEPAVNSRKAKTVKDVPLQGTDNIMMSKSKKQHVM